MSALVPVENPYIHLIYYLLLLDFKSQYKTSMLRPFENKSYFSPAVISLPGQQVVFDDPIIENLYAVVKFTIPQTPEYKVQIFSYILEIIVNHFDVCILSGNCNSSTMPEKLQEMIVLLIMSQKPRNILWISTDDITAALDALRKQLPVEKAKTIIKYYCGDFSVLLQEGIALYNQKSTTSQNNIFFDSKENRLETIPNDVHPFYNTLLSLEDQLSLSSTCKRQRGIYENSWMDKLTIEGQKRINSLTLPVEEPLFLHAKKLFLEYPQYRIEKYFLIDQKGIDYLQKDLGFNCGPVFIQRIKKGTLTLENLKIVMSHQNVWIDKFLKAISSRLGFVYPQIKLNELMHEALIKYCFDGSLTASIIDRLKTFNQLPLFFSCLMNKELQKYIDNSQITLIDISDNLRSVQAIISFLTREGIGKYLDNDKLKIPDLVNMLSLYNLSGLGMIADMLDTAIIQLYIDSGKITIEEMVNKKEIISNKAGNYFSSILSDQLAYYAFLTHCFDGSLLPELIGSLDKFKASGCYLLFSRLGHKAICKYLEKGKISVIGIINNFEIISSIIPFLGRIGIQKYLDNDKLEIADLGNFLFTHKLSGLRKIADVLDSEIIQTQIDSGKPIIKMVEELIESETNQRHQRLLSTGETQLY